MKPIHEHHREFTLRRYNVRDNHMINSSRGNRQYFGLSWKMTLITRGNRQYFGLLWKMNLSTAFYSFLFLYKR